MTQNLAEAARAAGIVDLDVLKLARPGAVAAAAIADLKARYPAAFRASEQNQKFRDMTLAERAAFERRHRLGKRWSR